jgi:hypothetical protein
MLSLILPQREKAMTKRVSEMTPIEHAAYREKRREENRRYRIEHPDAVKAARAKYRQSPAGKAAAARAYERRRQAGYWDQYIQRMKDQQPELWAERSRVNGASYRTRHLDRLLARARERGRSKNWQTSPNRDSRAQEGLVLLMAAIPRYLPSHVRDDVMGEVLLDIMDGKTRFDEIAKKIPEYVRAYNRQHDNHRVKSLDENIPGMKSSWLDALPDDAERF